jgi:hypothetical protein
MLNRFTGKTLALLGGLLLMASALAWGQGEISGFGGLASVSDGGGSHPTYGATIGVYAGRHVHLFGEYSRIPLAPSSYLTYVQGAVVRMTESERYDNFGGGVQIRWFVDKKVQPYILVPCIGAGRRTTSASNAGYGSAETYMYIGAGVGVRLFVGKNWGFKPEYRRQAYVNLDNFLAGPVGPSSVHMLTGGLFFQFGGQ